MNNDKILGLLGLAQRAGKIESGEEMVVEAIRRHKAKLVIVASDASQNTREKILNKGQYYQVPVAIELSTDELSQAIGKMRKVIAVCEKGFANKIKELLH